MFCFGGDEGDRTPYLLNAIQALSQVSYTPELLLMLLPLRLMYCSRNKMKNQYKIATYFKNHINYYDEIKVIIQLNQEK